MEKICQSCGNVFYKKPSESKRYWETKKYCSYQCSLKFTSIRKQENCYSTPLGHIPWNKELKYTEEQKSRLNLSGLDKGRAKGRKIPGLTGENHFAWKPKTITNCLNCGKELILAPWEVKSGKKFCSLNCFHKFNRGEKNCRFKGDEAIVKLKKRIAELAEYKEWHALVLKRDNWMCKDCGEKGSSLDVHHIESLMSILKRLNITTIKQARECKELFDLENGQTLCKRCHRKTDSYGRQTIKE